MHEIGVLYETAKTITMIAEQHHIDQVKFVVLEVGELAGVIPKIFEEYFPLIKEEFPVLTNSELIIRIVPGEALCNDCHSRYNVVKNEGKCPKCHSRYKTILGGCDIMIQQIGC